MKKADGQKLANIAQACAEDYMKYHDKDKDGKLSREEAKALLEHTWDASQRSLLLHGMIKDRIKEKEIASLLEVYEELFKRYDNESSGTHITKEGLENEFRDLFLKIQQTMGKDSWNDSKEPLNTYKLPETPPTNENARERRGTTY